MGHSAKMSNLDADRQQALEAFLAREELPPESLALVNIALTHKSFSNEFRAGQDPKLDKHNQRLEFLGDSVLGLVVADYYFHSNRRAAEGGLSRLKSMTVNESALKRVADALELGKLLRMGKGEIATGGLTRTSNLADAVEALIGAIYVSIDFAAAQKFVLKHFREILDNPDSVEGSRDFKSALQEILAKNHQRPEYIVEDARGPDHEKEFTIALFIADKKVSEGVARTRKQAEQAAAERYLTAANR